jgi:hypothetical protein
MLTWGRIAVADNQLSEQKSSLVIRVPLSANSYASIYYASSDGAPMSEREWWHLKQVVELASKVFVKQEEKAQAASAGA